MTPYKQAIVNEMTKLAENPLARVVGYGLKIGRAAGTFAAFDDARIAETTVAEGMMTGLAHGLSLAGLHPILYFERADFLYNAMDALVNHLSCASKISRGEFNPAVIIRVTVGNKNKPLFTGPTHTSNPAQAMRHLVDFPVLEARSEEDIRLHYETARFRQKGGWGSTAIFEFKDLM